MNAEMQQQRDFAGFFDFFSRGTGIKPLFLHRCVAHLCTSKGFQRQAALQSP